MTVMLICSLISYRGKARNEREAGWVGGRRKKRREERQNERYEANSHKGKRQKWERVRGRERIKGLTSQRKVRETISFP